MGNMSTQHNPQRHHRRSIRLQGYDYAQAGAYFVTICIQNRQCLLGHIADDQVCLTDAGRMIVRWWQELDHKFPSVELDACVVMPNHIHGVIFNMSGARVGADQRVGPMDARTRAPLPRIVQWFKTMTTNEYIRGVKENCWPAFHGRLW
jgi:putative transposase